MTLRSLDMVQVATYWPPGVNDGFGGLDFSAVEPTLIYCRWQDTAKLFRDVQGREQVSDAIVYVSEEVAIRGWLALGDFVGTGAGTAGDIDPVSVAGAYEIRQISVSPSLSNDEELWKVYL